jgi:ubiquinone/menaquinone biosynthesis C-methylase UbiE
VPKFFAIWRPEREAVTITLDIGGEGRHPGAVNLNLSRKKTLGLARGQCIPNLIVGRADRMPFADRSIAHIIVERTPLTQEALAEIARVIAPGGMIELAHVPWEHADRHGRALEMLPGESQQRRRRIAGQMVQETRFLVPQPRGTS